MTSPISLSGVYGANNVLIPKGGPKVVGANLDFSTVAEILIDGQQIVSQGQIEFLQGMFVDNADNGVSVSFEMSTTGQRLVIPARAQGYFAILVPNEPRIIARMSQLNNRRVRVLFYNVPIQSHYWLTQ